MSILKFSLNQLESRLQSLIEGGAARLLPLPQRSVSFSESLILAMQSGICMDMNRNRIAPNLYNLDVHPALAQTLRENQDLLNEFANAVWHAGLSDDLYFIAPPIIKINADPDLPYQRINVRAWITPQQMEETNTLALAGAMETSIPPNAYLILDGKNIYSLIQPVINIGRRVDNHIVIEDRRVSRLHAQLRVVEGLYVIFDLDSAGGTFVNGVKLQQCALFPGDVISLAGVELVYGQDTTDIVLPPTGSTEPITPFPR